MTNGFDQIQKMNQQGLDHAMKSFGTASESFQAIATELADYSKKSFDEGTAAFERVVGAPSPDKALEAQMSYMKSAYEGMVSEMTKLGELYAGLAKDMQQSTQAAFTGVVAK
ncbi:phasin family protein [Amorphus sp. 3PC139-8]|uniref:phasin family protein n=1 Tax=Amorphus sp. 3PC139-8 TaxID=2735676 RepID=UPI00345DBB92